MKPATDSWYVEQEQKIQDSVAESRRLRAECQRLFDPGYLYVVEFDSGVVKAGKARNAESRLEQHARAGLIRSSWSSRHHLGCSSTERQVIAFCAANGTLYGGREYFRDIAFGLVRAYAALVVQNARRRAYLDALIDAADGDLSVTWAEAHRLSEEAS